MNILECFTICRTPCCMLRVELSISSSHQSLKQRLPYPYLPDEKAEVSQGHFQGQTASSRREDSVSLGGVGPRAPAARGHFSLASFIACFLQQRSHAESPQPNLASGNRCSDGAASVSGSSYAHPFIPSLRPQNSAMNRATVIISVLHARKTDIQIKSRVPNVSRANSPAPGSLVPRIGCLHHDAKKCTCLPTFTGWKFYITNEDI